MSAELELVDAELLSREPGNSESGQSAVPPPRGGGSLNLLPVQRGFGIFSCSVRKKKTQAEIHQDYVDAVAALRGILAQREIADLQLNEGDFPEASVKINDATRAAVIDMLQKQRPYQIQQSHAALDQIDAVVKVIPERKEVATRAIIALTKVLKTPTPENIQELFSAQQALKTADPAFQAAALSLAGIGVSAWITGLVLTAVFSAAPPALGIFFGLLIVGGAVCMGIGLCMSITRSADAARLSGPAGVLETCGNALNEGLKTIGLRSR